MPSASHFCLCRQKPYLPNSAIRRSPRPGHVALVGASKSQDGSLPKNNEAIERAKCQTHLQIPKAGIVSKTGFRRAHSTRRCSVSHALDVVGLINANYRLTDNSGPWAQRLFEGNLGSVPLWPGGHPGPEVFNRMSITRANL